MVMSASALATEIEGAIDTKMSAAIGSAYDDLDSGFKTKFLRSISEGVAEAVVSHLTANVQVATTVAASIAVQVVPATGTGATTAPGSGTGTIS